MFIDRLCAGSLVARGTFPLAIVFQTGKQRVRGLEGSPKGGELLSALDLKTCILIKISESIQIAKDSTF